MEYIVNNVTVHKGVKMNVGNYESADIQIGFNVTPETPITSKADLDIFVANVSKDIDAIIKPQAREVREWAAKRFDGKGAK